jgi:hypothetical protein
MDEIFNVNKRMKGACLVKTQKGMVKMRVPYDTVENKQLNDMKKHSCITLRRSMIGLCLVISGCLFYSANAFGQYVFTGKPLPSVAEYSLHFAEDGAISAIHGLIAPQAWHWNGKTYVVYQGVNNAPQITYYEHKADHGGQWGPIIKIGKNPLGDLDTHGAPSMIIDKQGYIYVFFGSHGGDQIYMRTKRPEDITEWIAMPPVSGEMTYPCPTLLEDNSIVLIGRAGGHVSPWVEMVGTDNGRNWSQQRNILDFRPDGVYGTVKPGVDGQTIHFTFSIQKKVDLQNRAVEDSVIGKPNNWWTTVWDERNDCYYMWRDQQGKWRNIKGEELTLPVTLNSAREKCTVFQANWPHHGQMGVMGIYSDNTPGIVFLDGVLPKDKIDWHADKVDYTYKYARWDGKSWVISDITTTDSMWDLGPAIFPNTDDSIEVYLIAGGSVTVEGERTTNGRWGGDLQKWKSSDHGKSWVKVEDVITFEKTGRLFNSPLEVVNAHPDGKFVFCTWTTDQGYRSNDFIHNVYLYGDSGFCTKRNPLLSKYYDK